MAASPFGGHPTLAQYLAWARKQGCEANSGFCTDGYGNLVGITRIKAPSGRWVVEAAPQDEYLSPGEVDRLDRRLGLKSPWGSPTA